MDKIFNLINLPRDKANHAYYGLVIYSFIGLYDISIALAVTLAVGIGKEVYDYMNRDKHSPEILDAVAVVAVPMILFGIQRIIIWL